MTKPWLDTLNEGRKTREAISGSIPILETDRFTLRAPQLSDWPILEPIWTSHRGSFIGGPFSEHDAFLDFCQATAGWTFRGYGPFTVVEKETDEILGLIGIFHDYGDPAPEAGWLITETAEGKGIAFEAASAVLDWVRLDLKLPRLVSFIAIGNQRSVNLAKRLGAKYVETREYHDGPFFEYEHDTSPVDAGPTKDAGHD